MAGEQAREDLVDPFGRVIRDLRISVTDRCNFRCTYCMPAEGMEWLPRSEVLTFEEIHRVSRIFVERFGVEGIRLTGGEPTVRAHLPMLISQLSGLGVDLAMTTNGATLRNSAEELRSAGLRRINISLDTLHADRFEQMTRRNELENVLAGIDAAVADEALGRRPDGKVHLMRVEATFGEDGRCHVVPVRAQGSHQLAATATANAIAVVPDGDGLSAGDDVAVLLLG